MSASRSYISSTVSGDNAAVSEPTFRTMIAIQDGGAPKEASTCSRERIMGVSCGTHSSVTLFLVSTRTNPAAHTIAKIAEHIATADGRLVGGGGDGWGDGQSGLGQRRGSGRANSRVGKKRITRECTVRTS